MKRRLLRAISLVLCFAMMIPLMGNVALAGVPAAPVGEGVPTGGVVAERLTPIMGWASWNEYGARITQDILYAQMDAMVAHGLVEAGYEFFNIDDGFQGGRSEETGLVLSDPVKFSDGMKAIADYAHARGMKAGIYTDAGVSTCAQTATQNPDLEWQETGHGINVGLYDTATGKIRMEDLIQYFDTWGYDFIKVDWCGGSRLPGMNNEAGKRLLYTEIGAAIEERRQALGRDIIYNVCCWSFPGSWVVNIGADSWRTGGDIHATFADVMKQVDNIKTLAQYTGPGHINDLDMMQVGRGMSYDEDKSHFSMWCMMSTPLMLGSDLTKISEETLSIVKNEELIAINQDPACLQATVAKTISNTGGNTEIWSKDLGEKDSSTKAIAILNRGSVAQEITVNWSELGFEGEAASVRDLWQHKYLLGAETSYTVTVPSHGIVVLKVVGGEAETDDAASALQSKISAKGTDVNLTTVGSMDWAYPAAPEVKSGANVIGSVAYSGAQSAYADADTAYSWTNGKGTATGSAATGGVKVAGVGASYSFTVPSTASARVLKVYLGAEDSKIRIDATIAGKRITDYLAGTARTGGVYELMYRSQGSQPLDVTVTVEEANGANPAALLEAIALAAAAPALPGDDGGTLTHTVTMAAKPATMNLTAWGTADWVSYSSSGGAVPRDNPNTNVNRKAGVVPQITYAGGVGREPVAGNMYDAQVSYSWSDGYPTAVQAASNIQMGMNTARAAGEYSQITVPADENERTLRVPITSFRAYVDVVVTLGNEVIHTQSLAPGTAGPTNRVEQLITVTYKSEFPTTLSVKWSFVSGTNSSANASVEAAALTGPVILPARTTLSGSQQTVSGPVNYAAEGTVDYIRFGGADGYITARKPDANVLSSFAAASTANIEAVAGGVAQTGLNDYFELTLPASDTLKKASVYFGAIDAAVEISAAMGNERYSANVYDMDGGTNNVVTFWYQGADPLTVRLKLNSLFSQNSALRLDAVTLGEGGENIVLYPELSQEDTQLTIKTGLVKNAASGYSAATVVAEIYDASSQIVGTPVSVPVSLDTIGKVYEAVNNITLPSADFVGILKLRILDVAGNPLNDAFIFALPLAGREDNGYIGGIGAKAKVAAGAMLLDVRTAEEFALGEAGGAIPGAVNIPHTLLLTDPDGKLPADKNTEIIVYCSAGKRSTQAKSMLNDLGYVNVYNMGGFETWYEKLTVSMTGYDAVVMPGAAVAIAVAGSEPDELTLRYSVGKDSTIDDSAPYSIPVILASDAQNQIQVVKAYVLFNGEVVEQAQKDYYVFSNPDIPSLSELTVEYCSDMTPVKATVAYVGRHAATGGVGNDCTTEDASRKITIAGKTFDKGISAHAKSEITYAIPEGATRFIAVAGCDDDIGSRTIDDITYRIYIDGEVAQAVSLAEKRYFIFDIEIPEGAKEIRLFAGPTKSLSNANMHSSWGLAAFAIAEDETEPVVAQLDIRGNASGDVDKSVEYIVSMENMKNVLNVRSHFEVNWDYLDPQALELLHAAFASVDSGDGAIRWTPKENNKWEGDILLLYLGNGEGFTSAEAVDLFKVLYTAKQVGNATMKLTGLEVVGIDENDDVDFLDGEIRTTEATTLIKLPDPIYSIYDLNKDGRVDERDLGLAQRYYQVREGDANWAAAQVCDFVQDGVIDMLDLVDLFLHFTG